MRSWIKGDKFIIIKKMCMITKNLRFWKCFFYVCFKTLLYANIKILGRLDIFCFDSLASICKFQVCGFNCCYFNCFITEVWFCYSLDVLYEFRSVIKACVINMNFDQIPQRDHEERGSKFHSHWWTPFFSN